VHKICSTCPTCQKTKKSNKKYGYLPEKKSTCHTLGKLCVDLIGPYHIKNKANNQILRLWSATGRLEMKELKNKEATTVANTVD